MTETFHVFFGSGEENVTQITFQLGNLPHRYAYASSGAWAGDFDMGAVNDNMTLTVSAVGDFIGTIPTITKTIKAVAGPDWFNPTDPNTSTTLQFIPEDRSMRSPH